MRRALLLLGFAVFLGCSSSEDGGSSAAETGSGPIAFAAPKADVELILLANAGSERIVQGFFATGRRTGNTCTTETVEGCVVSTCTATDDATAGTVVDPGTVTVSSTTFGDAPLPAVDPKTGFTRLIGTGDLPAGEEVRVSSKGAALPAFDLKVKSPGAFTAVSFAGCTKSATGTCEVTAAAPVAKWNGGSKVVTVSLAPALDTPTKISLRCAFDGSKGAGQIPAAALARLPRDKSYLVGWTGYDDAATTSGTPSVSLVSQRWPAPGTGPTSVHLK